MNGTSTEWITRIRPCIDGSAGSRLFSAPVINPLRVIYDHELFMFGSGVARMVVEGREYVCPAHSYIIIPPGCRHISYVVSHEPVLVHWAHFTWCHGSRPPGSPIVRYLPARVEPELLQPAPPFVPEGVLYGEVRDAHIYDLHARVSHLYRGRSVRDRILSGIVFLEELTELLVTNDEDGTLPDRDMQLAETVRECLDRVSNRPFAETGSVKAALAALGQSYYHLARVFRRAYGLSPLDYINARRTARISDLLRDTDLPVSEIAEKLGFEDVSYFSRFVRKHLGFSPRDFRRRRAGGDGANCDKCQTENMSKG